MRDAQQLYNTRFAAGCQQFLQRFLHLFQIFSFGLFLIKITLVFPLPWRPSAQKAAPQAPEVPACGAAFAHKKNHKLSLWKNRAVALMGRKRNSFWELQRRRPLPAAEAGRSCWEPQPVTANFQFLKMLCPSGTALLQRAHVLK